MATSYPGGIDSFVNPDPADALDSVSVPHAGQHSNANDAIEAIETELGTDPAGGSATVAARFGVIEADDWVTSARIADGAVDTARLADDAVTVAKIEAGTVGRIIGTGVDGDVTWRESGAINLLTAQKADSEAGAAFDSLTNGTQAQTADEAHSGTYSTAVTHSNTSNMACYLYGTGTGGIPVLGGQVYTFSYWAKFDATRSAGYLSPRIYWYTEAGAAASTSVTAGASTQFTAVGSAWTRVYVTAVAPADAAFARPTAYYGTNTAGLVDYYDDGKFHYGNGGEWVTGGRNIPNLGFRWDETVGRRLFLWDGYNQREQMVYGDTGIRDISLETSYTPSAYAVYSTTTSNADQYLRRVGYTVSFSILLTVDAANYSSGTSCFNFPAGFRPWGAGTRLVVNGVRVDDWTTVYPHVNGTAIYLRGLVSGSAEVLISGTFTTTDTWPTSLPGTASGSIPSA